MTVQGAIRDGSETLVLQGYLDSMAMIERLHRLLLDVIKDEFERLRVDEINPVQALLLFNVAEHEVTAGELKSRGYYQGSNVSYNLKKLVEMGYMHHQRSDIDRRSVRVKLTDKGRVLRGQIFDLFRRHSGLLAAKAGITVAGLEDVNLYLRRLERFWGEQIRYIY